MFRNNTIRAFLPLSRSSKTAGKVTLWVLHSLRATMKRPQVTSDWSTKALIAFITVLFSYFSSKQITMRINSKLLKSKSPLIIVVIAPQQSSSWVGTGGIPIVFDPILTCDVVTYMRDDKGSTKMAYIGHLETSKGIATTRKEDTPISQTTYPPIRVLRITTFNKCVSITYLAHNQSWSTNFDRYIKKWFLQIWTYGVPKGRVVGGRDPLF